MTFRVQPTPGSKACTNCASSPISIERCNEHSACLGYGTRINCPPLIVLAVIECSRLALVATSLPVFSSMSNAHA